MTKILIGTGRGGWRRYGLLTQPARDISENKEEDRNKRFRSENRLVFSECIILG